MNNQHHTYIFEAIYHLSAHYMHFNVALSTEWKILFSLIKLFHCAPKSRKIYHPQFRDT